MRDRIRVWKKKKEKKEKEEVGYIMRKRNRVKDRFRSNIKRGKERGRELRLEKNNRMDSDSLLKTNDKIKIRK